MMAANKVKGKRCALLHSPFTAEKAATSNNANVIAIGAKVSDTENLEKAEALALITWFLENKRKFDPNSNSARNVDAIMDLEN